MKTKYLAFVLLLALVSCGEKINFEKVTAPMSFINVYSNSDTREVNWEGPVAIYERGNPEMQEFIQWLENNPTGWKPDFSSYVIPTMLVESDSFALFVFDGFVNLVLGQELYSKNVPNGTFDFLLPTNQP